MLLLVASQVTGKVIQLIQSRRLVGGPHEGTIVNYDVESGSFVTRFGEMAYVYTPYGADFVYSPFADELPVLVLSDWFDAIDRAAECVGDEAERYLASM